MLTLLKMISRPAVTVSGWAVSTSAVMELFIQLQVYLSVVK